MALHMATEVECRLPLCCVYFYISCEKNFKVTIYKNTEHKLDSVVSVETLITFLQIPSKIVPCDILVVLKGYVWDIDLEMSDNILCTDTLCGPRPSNVTDICLNIEYQSPDIAVRLVGNVTTVIW
jgi:hypothetical protein